MVTAPWFTTAVLVVIVANAVALGLETYDGVETRWGDELGVVNDVCLGIFVLELVLRIGASGGRPWAFFRDGWNLFDFVVVAVAFVPGIRESSTLLRLARLARVVRIVRLFPDLRVLLAGVWRSLPPLFAIALATGMLLFVYGMVGWTLFGATASTIDPDASAPVVERIAILRAALDELEAELSAGPGREAAS